MPEPQLSVRGADVIELAHRLSEEEGRSIRAVVTDALQAYAERKRVEKKRATEALWADFDAVAAEIRATVDSKVLADEREDDLYDEDGLPS